MIINISHRISGLYILKFQSLQYKAYNDIPTDKTGKYNEWMWALNKTRLPWLHIVGGLCPNCVPKGGGVGSCSAIHISMKLGRGGHLFG